MSDIDEGDLQILLETLELDLEALRSLASRAPSGSSSNRTEGFKTRDRANATLLLATRQLGGLVIPCL